MYESWVFATTLAAGSGLVAYAIALQPDTAPPSIAPEPPVAVHVIPPAPPAPIPEPTAKNPVLELNPIVIQGRIHRRAAAATPPQPTQDVIADKPCSDWRDLGPTHVVAGTPSGELAVRSLCP